MRVPDAGLEDHGCQVFPLHVRARVSEFMRADRERARCGVWVGARACNTWCLGACLPASRTAFRKRGVLYLGMSGADARVARVG